MGTTKKELSDVHIHLMLDPETNMALRQVAASEKVYGTMRHTGELIDFLIISNPIIRSWMALNNTKGLKKLDEKFTARGYNVQNGNRIDSKG